MTEMKIKIKDLRLWDENPRFPEEYFNKTEEELINFLFNKKGEKEKLKDLAKSIIENIKLIPWERLIVYNEAEEYIVLEGNRRLMIYKLLINPELLKDKKLSATLMKVKGIINENLEIECIVTDNFEEGLKYVELKHLEKGYKGWGEAERNNFKRRRGKAGEKEILKIEVTRRIKSLDIPDKLKEEVLGHGFITTFFRIVTTSPALEYFGYSISDNKLSVDDKDFNNKLKIIVWNVINKKDFGNNPINSRSLNTNEEIKKYLKNLNINEDLPKFQKEVESSYVTKVDVFNNKRKKFVSPTEKSSKSKQSVRIKPRTSSRNRLIPKDTKLFINEAKINNIYRELRDDLDINKTVNATGVLFRVFLETTIDLFAKKKGFAFSENTKLTGKITKVCDYLEKKCGISQQDLKNIRKVATNKQSVLSINNFHDYVHSLKVIPAPDDLKYKWDNLESFFTIVYNDILRGKK